MNETAPEELFDQIVASALSRASLTPSTPKRTGLATLRLNPKAVVVHQTSQVRSIAQIDPGLRSHLRELVSGKSPWPFFLHGQPGGGKTCSALCLLDYAGGEYWALSRWLNELIQADKGRLTWSYEGRSGDLTVDMLWSRWRYAALAVLDEVGTRDHVSDFHYESLQRCLDDRHGKPLVVVSNLDPAALERAYDYRIVSRLTSGTVVQLGGKDRRIDAA